MTISNLSVIYSIYDGAAPSQLGTGQLKEGYIDTEKDSYIMCIFQISPWLRFTLISIETVKLASSQHRFYFDVHKVCGKLGRGKTALGGW